MVVGIARIAPGPFLQLGSGARSFKKNRRPPYRQGDEIRALRRLQREQEASPYVFTVSAAALLGSRTPSGPAVHPGCMNRPDT
jgi:hypothetical protein